MLGNRALRLSAATMVLAAAGMTLAPHATSYVASSAVVNAPVIPLKAPFDGVIRAQSPGLADPVRPGAALLVVAADRADRTGLAALEAERATLAGERESLARLKAGLETLEAGLEARRSSHAAAYADWIAARAAAAGARAAEARIRHAQAVDDLNRNARLAASGAVAATHLDDDRAEAEAAAMALARADSDRRTLEMEAAAMRAGVALDDAGGGLAQIGYRLDEIALRRAEIEAQETALEARAAAVEAQIATLRARADTREVFAPEASAAGVIWKASAPAGSAVMTGDEVARVLDCSHRFIEVSVAERHFERIRTGSPAWVRLKGADGWFTAEVEAVRGAGGRFDRPALAAEVPREDTTQLSVIVRLPVAEVARPEVAHAFCDVGRTADVRFGRPETAILARLRRAFDAVTTRAAALGGGSPGRAAPEGGTAPEPAAPGTAG